MTSQASHKLIAMTKITGDIKSSSQWNSGGCQLVLKTLYVPVCEKSLMLRRTVKLKRMSLQTRIKRDKNSKSGADSST